MHQVRLKLITSALFLLAASACVLAPMEGDDEGAVRDALAAKLEGHTGVDQAFAQGTDAENDALTVPDQMLRGGRMYRSEAISGPTPDPWHGGSSPGDCVSLPTPDPWNPAHSAESDGRPGSTGPDQGSSANGTKPKN